MKNKKVTYILLPLALLIWGIILYKIFFYKDVEENNTFLPQTGKMKETFQIEPDTFTLQLNYQDPFLKNASRQPIAPKTSENDQPKTKEVVKPVSKPAPPPITFPALRYEGRVKHSSQGKELVIININGKSKFVQIGETVDNVKLLQACNDSIIVCYEKQNKTIRKN